MNLDHFLEARAEKVDACIDRIDHSLLVTGIDATLRFHLLKIDGNKQPKVRDLVACLADHIIGYCMSSRRRQGPVRPDEWARLTREAYKLFRALPQSGEAGEMLLYLLIETVIRAPQMVAKVELKTNPKVEIHGSDGIHMRWNPTDQLLDVYFGESKLEQKASSALDSAFDSIAVFHKEDMFEHECGIVTAQYKWADDALRKAVLEYIDRGSPSGDCRVNHACLIGFDWPGYGKHQALTRAAMIKEVSDEYGRRAEELHKLVQKKFDKWTLKALRFDVFFLPFADVQSFRDTFNEVLTEPWTNA